MGMSSYVIGFRPPDEKWQKMKDVFDACTKAGIEIPNEVDDFFEYDSPDESGVVVNIQDAVESWDDGDVRDGLQVVLSKLPKDVKIIRFYNSY